MKDRRFITLFATIPLIGAILAIQSCAGVGGPTTLNGGQGSVTADFLALLSDAQRSASYIGPQPCSADTCHGSGPDSNYTHWQSTKHFANNVTCENCHGPGSAHQANPTSDNILTFPRIAAPVVCAQCHGPIYDQYKFSLHSQLIEHPVDGAITSPESTGRSSRCIACHGGLFRTMTYDGDLDIATMPAEEIQQIAEDILTTANGVNHTANCNTCHDPHSLTGNLTDEGEDVQLRHMTFNLDTTAVGPGTDPQSFQTVDHLCGQCHNGRGVDPSDAALTANTSRFSGHHSDQYNMLLGIGGVVGDGPVQTQTSHANIPGQCSHCHMPDHRHTFTVSYNACIPCHTETDAANRVTSIKTLVLNDLYALRVRMSNWAIAAYPNVDGNEFFWDYRSAISSEGFTPPDQSTVPIEIKRARHNYYFIVESKDFGVHNAIYVKLLLKVANDNLDALGVPAAPLTATSVSTAQKMNTVQSDANRSAKGGEGTD